MKNFIGLTSAVFVGLMTTLAQTEWLGGLLRNQVVLQMWVYTKYWRVLGLMHI